MLETDNLAQLKQKKERLIALLSQTINFIREERSLKKKKKTFGFEADPFFVSFTSKKVVTLGESGTLNFFYFGSGPQTTKISG